VSVRTAGVPLTSVPLTGELVLRDSPWDPVARYLPVRGQVSAEMVTVRHTARELTVAGTLDADAPKTFSTTPSGLQYRVLRKGAGANPKPTSKVKVHYHGWLDNGKVFDSSYQRGESIDFPLNQVIPGWTEGMQLVGEGGMIELVIPSNLGYGKRGTPGGPIPPDATLHFLVELLDVK
jgi:FKBP-type peptidyl-prolyl cis-trans isomerase